MSRYENIFQTYKRIIFREVSFKALVFALYMVTPISLSMYFTLINENQFFAGLTLIWFWINLFFVFIIIIYLFNRKKVNTKELIKND